VLFEVFLDRFLGFTDVESEKNEPFGGEFLADLVDEGGFVRAVAALSGPEFKQSYLALDGPIGELFAGRRGGGKTRGGSFSLEPTARSRALPSRAAHSALRKKIVCTRMAAM
jgi:hypothetical protein